MNGPALAVQPWPLFVRLLLGHLVGDFVLQWNAVYRWKSQHPRGLALHTAIVYAAMVLFAGPYRSPFILALLTAAGVAHYLLDHLKMNWRRYPPALAGFLLDQAAHVGVIGLVTWLAANAGPAGLRAADRQVPAPGAPGAASVEVAWMLGASGAIAATYVLEFVGYFLAGPPDGYPAPFRRDMRALVYRLVAYAGGWAAWAVHPAGLAVGLAAAWLHGRAGGGEAQRRAGEPAPACRPGRWLVPAAALALGLLAGLPFR